MRPEDGNAILAQLRSFQDMFAKGVGIVAPWHVTDIALVAHELEVRVDLANGVVTLACPKCQAPSPVYDRGPERRWRTLDDYMFKSFLVARPVRVRCAEHGVHRLAVPGHQAPVCAD